LATNIVRTRTETDTVRLNVNLNVEAAAALHRIAEQRDISFTEAVRRAISVYDYMEQEKSAGRIIQTANAERGDIREVILM
jgi:hypothetical protein